MCAQQHSVGLIVAVRGRVRERSGISPTPTPNPRPPVSVSKDTPVQSAMEETIQNHHWFPRKLGTGLLLPLSYWQEAFSAVLCKDWGTGNPEPPIDVRMRLRQREDSLPGSLTALGSIQLGI